MTIAPMPLEPGVVIANYRLLRRLAAGGMAEVFEVAHVLLPRKAALKVMHLELLRTEGGDARFLREACILESFEHPGGVRVFDCGVLPDGRPWLAMELVLGEPLSTRMMLPMEPDEVTGIIATVCEVLAAAHSVGLIHRDLKPDNLLLSSKPGAFSVRVIDWGLARLDCLVKLSQDGFVGGTPLYMAPEQALGKPHDGTCDVYSLGVVAYEALAGVPPYRGGNLAQIVVEHLTTTPAALYLLRADVSLALSELVSCMLACDPLARPQAAAVRTRAAALLAEPSRVPREIVEYEALELCVDRTLPPDGAGDGGGGAEMSPIRLQVAAPTMRWRHPPALSEVREPELCALPGRLQAARH